MMIPYVKSSWCWFVLLSVVGAACGQQDGSDTTSGSAQNGQEAVQTKRDPFPNLGTVEGSWWIDYGELGGTVDLARWGVDFPLMGGRYVRTSAREEWSVNGERESSVYSLHYGNISGEAFGIQGLVGAKIDEVRTLSSGEKLFGTYWVGAALVKAADESGEDENAAALAVAGQGEETMTILEEIRTEAGDLVESAAFSISRTQSQFAQGASSAGVQSLNVSEARTRYTERVRESAEYTIGVVEVEHGSPAMVDGAESRVVIDERRWSETGGWEETARLEFKQWAASVNWWGLEGDASVNLGTENRTSDQGWQSVRSDTIRAFSGTLGPVSKARVDATVRIENARRVRSPMFLFRLIGLIP
jgi:hypothetical protein